MDRSLRSLRSFHFLLNSLRYCLSAIQKLFYRQFCEQEIILVSLGDVSTACSSEVFVSSGGWKNWSPCITGSVQKQMVLVIILGSLLRGDVGISERLISGISGDIAIILDREMVLYILVSGFGLSGFEGS